MFEEVLNLASNYTMKGHTLHICDEYDENFDNIMMDIEEALNGCPKMKKVLDIGKGVS